MTSSAVVTCCGRARCAAPRGGGRLHAGAGRAPAAGPAGRAGRAGPFRRRAASAIAEAQPSARRRGDRDRATARGEHAKVLQAEVDRARPPVSSSKPAPPAAQPPAVPGGGAAALIEALTAAEKAGRRTGAVRAALPRGHGRLGGRRVREPAGGARMTSQPAVRCPPTRVDAAQDALGAEHAALWVYGLVSAFLPGDVRRARCAEGTTAHRARRDATELLLAGAGQTPAARRARVRPAAAGDRPGVGDRGAGGGGDGHDGRVARGAGAHRRRRPAARRAGRR